MITTISGLTGFSGNVLLKKTLLICGILSSFLYVALTIIGAMQWEGYNSISQTVSELFAIDAPSRSLVIPLMFTYSLLMFAFGLGILLSSYGKRSLRFVGGLIIGKEVLGSVATLLAPMHLRGVDGTLTDTMHAVITGIGVLLLLLTVGFGAASFGKKFRFYSIATFLILCVFGTLSGLEGPQLAANQPTPLLGIWERINIFSYMLWVVVLSVILLQAEKKQDYKKIFKRFLQVVLQVVLFAILLFVSSGQIEWIWAWIYLCIYVLVIIINAFILPADLIEERGKSKENVKKWDKIIMTLNIFPALGILVVAGLDYRLNWSSSIADWIHVSALFLMILGQAFFSWSMISNHFFSTAVRLQFDRSHQVATRGPYKYVRHPGYVGFIILNLATPLVLGSLWALIPATILTMLFIIRTALEDRTLINELDGYIEYSQKVRYRLIPLIW
jgi:protein-S-isoprenylcysteine O-methyltransferase Ste14